MGKRPLDKQLLEEPYRFQFFQAVRLLEKIYPAKKPVGGEALPADEIVRFRSTIGLDFPASQINEFIENDGDGADGPSLEMLVNFMGMVGVSGVLPVHYTELVLDRIRHRDRSAWAFLDIFTHRAVSLFYRAWRKYRFPVAYESGSDEFTSYLFDFAGLGTNGLRGRMSLPDESLLPYAGLIAQKPHTSNSLENILSDYFGTTAKVQQMFGQWIDLDKADYSRLGAKNSSVGVNAIAGTRIWDQQSKFRVVLGPLTFKQFQDFLPSGTAHKPLGSIIRFMVGLELDFDVQLKLEKRQVPSTVLTTRAVRRPMLGWTSYLKTQAMVDHDVQVILDMDA